MVFDVSKTAMVRGTPRNVPEELCPPLGVFFNAHKGVCLHFAAVEIWPPWPTTQLQASQANAEPLISRKLL